jgi:hypothetical protein
LLLLLRLTRTLDLVVVIALARLQFAALRVVLPGPPLSLHLGRSRLFVARLVDASLLRLHGAPAVVVVMVLLRILRRHLAALILPIAVIVAPALRLGGRRNEEKRCCRR